MNLFRLCHAINWISSLQCWIDMVDFTSSYRYVSFLYFLYYQVVELC